MYDTMSLCFDGLFIFIPLSTSSLNLTTAPSELLQSSKFLEVKNIINYIVSWRLFMVY